ncbi:unnamed protein product, partial [Vitis vinifera]
MSSCLKIGHVSTSNTMENASPELHLDDLPAIQVLGKGAMGTVFLVHDRLADPSALSPFALKVVDKFSHHTKLDADRRARWEISVLKRLSNPEHPFLPTLIGSLETPEFLAWAVPFCPGGDLNVLRYHQTDRVFSPSVIRFYVAEIICALEHLHSMGIAYRDLKPENVLIQQSGHVTLTDFDLSRSLKPRTSFSNGERSNSFVGTEEYVSPEVVRGDGHEFAVDWWALGILTYEMLYGTTPFKGKNRKETFRNVLMKTPEFIGKRTALTDLIGRLLEKDPTKRLGYNRGASEIKQHVFFRGLQWDKLTEVLRPPFLPSMDDELLTENITADEFDIREYFQKTKVKPSLTPSTSSRSMFSTIFSNLVRKWLKK